MRISLDFKIKQINSKKEKKRKERPTHVSPDETKKKSILVWIPRSKAAKQRNCHTKE